MKKILLNEQINSLPLTTKTTLWQFIRGDLKVNAFEKWLYSNQDLDQVLANNSYLDLIMIDYKDIKEIDTLKIIIFQFLIQFPEACLCSTFPDNTMLFPYVEDKERIVFEKQIDLLKPIVSIKSFSGRPPSYYSRWYHPGRLCNCIECKTDWFVVFEESESSEYYFVRIGKKDAILISQQNSWPNENWPSHLKDWHAFLNLDFQNWHSLYKKKNEVQDAHHFLMNYDLGISSHQ